MTHALYVSALSLLSCSLAPSLGVPTSGSSAPAVEDQGRLLFKHRRAAQCLAFSPDGKTLVSGGQDGEILLYDMDAGGEPARLEGHKGAVTALAFAEDGRLYSGEMYQLVKAWDTSEKKELASAKEHRSRITAVTWLAEPKLVASTSIDKTVRLWKPEGLEALQSLEGHKYQPTGLVSLANGKWMASCDDGGNIVFWEVEGGTEKSRFEPEERIRFACLAASPDGKTLVLGDDREEKVYLFDVERNAIRKTVEGARARCLAFSPDGKSFVVGGHDNRVLLHDSSTGDLLAAFADHGRAVLGVTFSPDGESIASGAMDGNVRLWKVPER